MDWTESAELPADDAGFVSQFRRVALGHSWRNGSTLRLFLQFFNLTISRLLLLLLLQLLSDEQLGVMQADRRSRYSIDTSTPVDGVSHV